MTRPSICSTMHDQLVQFLKAAIEEGRWKNGMSSEAKLCREFHVSRMTLRKALAQLAAEGWIELGGRGKYHHVLRQSDDVEVASARTIRILTPFDLNSWSWSGNEHMMLKEMADIIAQEGYHMEVECVPRGYKNFQPSRLEQLDSLPDTAGWVLMFSTEKIQQWFANRQRPTLVLGMTAEDVALSSIYSDAMASGRHAAGLLYSRGHRQMVYLVRNVTSIGDKVCAKVFTEEAMRLGARARIISYDAKPESISRMMMDLIASRPRPTAFVVGDSSIAITVLCHLQAMGIAVPSAASVLSMWNEPGLDLTYPTIAHYGSDMRYIGRKAGELLLQLIRNRSAKKQKVGLIPEYIPGGSISSLNG